MKINQRLENIFAHAVALNQSGRLRSTIFCIGDRVYIFNQDRTVLLRFSIRKTEVQFHSPLSFHANDYDSNVVEERDGKIVFVKEGDNWKREKSCKAPEGNPEDVEKLFKAYSFPEQNQVTIGGNVLSLLDESLSHLEFSGRGGALRIVQRNIYTGSLIRICRKESEGLGLSSSDNIKDFEPIGIRTDDFLALYTFVNTWRFCFPTDGGTIWGKSVDPKLDAKVLVSKCMFDELGGNDNGREKQKKRWSK